MEKITFEGSQGEMLAARLDKPQGEIKACALFAHCFTCSKDIFAASRIAKSLMEKNIAVLRFDFTGLGQSEGEFANTNFSSNVQDLVKAADYMRENLKAPSILIGHSLGGAAVLAAAKYVDEAKAIVTISAPADAAHVTHNFGDKQAEIMTNGEAEVSLAGRPFTIRKQFIDDVQSQNLKNDIENLGKALLVMHAPLDKTVGIANASEIFTSAKHPKSFVTLDDADHLLSKRQDAEYAANVIAVWVNRYIQDKAKTSQQDNDPVPADTVRVTSTGNGKFQQRITVGHHTLLADEPESFGGDDTGPTPYDFLKMALGACKSMTIAMYARRKNLPLEGVEVQVKHNKIHAQDCENCETEDGKIDEFLCEINVKGDNLTDDEHKRLVEIAEKCPVHKTFSGEITVKTVEKK